MNKKILLSAVALLAVLGLANFVIGYAGEAPKVVVEGNYIEASNGEAELGGFFSPGITGESFAMTAINKSSIYGTTTLKVSDSGTTYMWTGSGTRITLPKVEKGLNFRFVISAVAAGSLGTNYVVASNEGDNIDGTLIVAGAVVDCRGEDFINFVADGEAAGDYVELISNGSQWYISNSGGLTTAKITCTDPS